MTDRGYHARLRAAAAAAAASSTRPLSSAETNVRFASDPSASKLSKETRDAARLEALRSVEETLARSRRSSTSPPAGASSAPQPSVARAGSFNAAGTSSTSSTAREQPRRGGLERSVSDATNVSSRRDAIPSAAYYPRSSLFDVDVDTDGSESSNGTAGDDGESPSSASSSDEKENAGPGNPDADPEDAAWTPPPPPDSPDVDDDADDDVEDDAEDDERENSAEAPATPDGGTESGGGARYRGVSEWMDAVVAQAKAVRRATGMMNGGMNGGMIG